MQDRFNRRAASLEGPASHAFAISPDDAAEVSEATRAVYVGTAGDMTCRLVDDTSDVVFTAVGAGTILPIRVSHVRATGTSAGNLVGLC